MYVCVCVISNVYVDYHDDCLLFRHQVLTVSAVDVNIIAVACCI